MAIRQFRRRPAPRTAFVLGGGGNLGATQVGMLRALFERGIVPDVLIGCSVGAVNAAAIAADPSERMVAELERVWNAIDGEDVFPSGRLSGLWFLTRKGKSLHSADGLRRLLTDALPYEHIEDATVPLHVVATSLRTGRDRWFTRGPIVDAVLASAALPAVLPPVAIGGELFIDGGVVDNVPVMRALQVPDVTRVYVLHVGNFDRPRPEPKRPVDVLLQAFSIARNYRWRCEIEDVPDGIDVITLPAVDPGPLRYNDFSRSRSLIERGHALAATYLDTSSFAVAGQ